MRSTGQLRMGKQGNMHSRSNRDCSAQQCRRHLAFLGHKHGANRQYLLRANHAESLLLSYSAAHNTSIPKALGPGFLLANDDHCWYS